MRRFLMAVGMTVLLVGPVAAQDHEVGEEYEITIATEEENQYVGAYGQVRMGSVLIMIPDAKVDERYRVSVTEVRTNQYSNERQVSCDFEQIGGDRTGECIGAP